LKLNDWISRIFIDLRMDSSLSGSKLFSLSKIFRKKLKITGKIDLDNLKVKFRFATRMVINHLSRVNRTNQVRKNLVLMFLRFIGEKKYIKKKKQQV